jgi:beta-fructofuranosidase
VDQHLVKQFADRFFLLYYRPTVADQAFAAADVQLRFQMEQVRTARTKTPGTMPRSVNADGTLRMVVANRHEERQGAILLFRSGDGLDWRFVGEIDASRGEYGRMWECPDFFRLDGRDILLMSPQGLEPQGDCFRNLNQTGYLLGSRDEHEHLVRKNFTEIDRGHDFYATQTMLAPDGRRLMTAWMNAWDSPMQEKEDGWAGALTLPRELRVEKGRLYQQPARETASMRTRTLLAGSLAAGSRLPIPATSELELEFREAGDFNGSLLKITGGTQQLEISLDAKGGRIIVQRTTQDGSRAARLLPFEDLKLHIFVDKSSAEIFVNEGELTFTERIYWQEPLELSLSGKAAEAARVYALEKETNQY